MCQFFARHEPVYANPFHKIAALSERGATSTYPAQEAWAKCELESKPTMHQNAPFVIDVNTAGQNVLYAKDPNGNISHTVELEIIIQLVSTTTK